MATITVRALDPVTWEPQYGNGQNNFISDLAAVAQIIATRCRLFTGEWFLNLADGLPMFQTNQGGTKILGGSGSQANIEAIINIIALRITGSPYVIKITTMTSTFQNRKFSFYAAVLTQFGTVYVTNSPGTSASLLTTST